MAKISRENQVQADRARRKYQTDQTLRQNIQSASRRETPASEPRRCFFLERAKKKVVPDGQPQANQHVGNEESRKDVGADGGRQDYSRVESPELTVRVPAQPVGCQQQRQHAQHERQARTPVADPENTVAGGQAPIHQRSLFQVADAVGVHRHPIVTDQHLPRSFGMDGVHVIEQSGREHACEINHAPQQANDQEGFRTGDGSGC